MESDIDEPPKKAPKKRGEAVTATEQHVKSLVTEQGQPLRLEMYAGGLGVRVYASGAKSFVYQYRSGAANDTKRMVKLGDFDPPRFGVADAYKALRAAQTMRDAGTDPAAAKVAAKARRRSVARGEAIDPTALTVRQAFDLWRANDLAPFVDTDGTRHGRKDGGAALAQQFAKHVWPAEGPTLGPLPLRSLGKGDVLALVDRLKKAGARRTAAVMLSSLRQMLDWCEDRDYIAANPTRTLKKARIIGRAAVRTRVLDDAELKLFARKLAKVDLHVVTVLALRFVLATGQRPGEVAGMPKAELDKAGKLWTIPASRYKTGERHEVPLSAHARAIVAEAAKFNSDSPYVFPSPTDADCPIDRHSLSRAVLRKHAALGIEAAFTPHDLRRTCRTRLAALGVPDYVAEKVIGHRLEGMLAIYNQHTYLDERRDALERWGKALALMDKLSTALVKPLDG